MANKKASTKKFYVQYVENSNPTLLKFKSLKDAKEFVVKFKKKYPSPNEGWWIDYIVVGKILEADEYYEKQL